MSDWPSKDDAAAYQLPREAPEPVSVETRRLSLAGERLSQRLPVSRAILDEVLELQKTRDGIETRAEDPELERSRALVGEVQAALADASDVLGGVRRCWIDGRGGVCVRLTGELERYRRLLEAQFGSDRIRVEQTGFAAADGPALQSRLRTDAEDLAQHGVRVTGSGTGLDGFQLTFYAWDQLTAEQLLRDRYGPGLILKYKGASHHTFSSFPFASWLAEGDLLHVFYASPGHGDRLGGCQAFEDAQSVLVALSVKDSRLPKRRGGRFTPSHATVQLERPLGTRVVIDDHANRTRPHWTNAPEDPTRFRAGR